jgi:hypothetical protein
MVCMHPTGVEFTRVHSMGQDLLEGFETLTGVSEWCWWRNGGGTSRKDVVVVCAGAFGGGLGSV